MALKIALPRVLGYVEPGSSGNLSGSFGSVFRDFYRSMFVNVSFVVREASGDTLLHDDSDAKTNETTFKDLFMRNEADVFGILLEYRTIINYLSPSCPVFHISGAALHLPPLAVTNQNVLDALNIFSLGSIIGIFGSVALLAIFLKLTKKIHLIDSTSSLSKCLINQANFNAGLLKAKALIMFWLICSFLIMEIYEQAINADMVNFDYSRIVESLIDLDRHESYAVLFPQGDPILNHFKWSPDPVKQRLWKRKNKGVNLAPYLAFHRKFDENEVYIGSWYNVMGTGEYLCGRDKDTRLQKRSKYLVATKDFGSASVGFHYRANLPENVKRKIWHRSLKMGEAGVAENLAEKCRRPVSDMSQESTSTCLCFSKEELYDDVVKLRPIGSENISSLIEVFCLLWVFLVAVFFAEFVSNGIRVLRHRNSNTVTPFLGSDSPSHSQCVKGPTTDPNLKPGSFVEKQTEVSEGVSGKKSIDQMGTNVRIRQK